MSPRALLFVAVILTPLLTLKANEPVFYRLQSEPLIRIGLSTNASSVSITTPDTQLVAYSPDEPGRYLAVNRVSVTARVYQPPEIEEFRIEFQNVPAKADADDLAKDIRESTGQTALVSVDVATSLWTVWVGGVKGTEEDAGELKAALAEKGFEDAVVVTEKKLVPSADAIALSQQVRTAGKSEVRSLVRNTGASRPMIGRPGAAGGNCERAERTRSLFVAQGGIVRFIQ
jgi:hypothetical protein